MGSLIFAKFRARRLFRESSICCASDAVSVYITYGARSGDKTAARKVNEGMKNDDND